MFFTRKRCDRGFFRQAEVVAMSNQNIVLRYVIARSIEKESAHYVCRRCHFRIRSRIHFNEVRKSTRILDAKSWSNSFALCSDDRKWRLWATMNSPTFPQLFDRQ